MPHGAPPMLGPLCRPGRSAVAHTFRCADAGGARGELQAVAAQRRQAGLPAPRDLGDRIVLPQGAALAAADFGLFGDAQSAEAEWGGQPAAPASPSECGSLGDAEPRCGPRSPGAPPLGHSNMCSLFGDSRCLCRYAV